MSFREFTEELRKKGYFVRLDSSVKGRSGAVHHVDLLAEDKKGEKKIIGVKKCCKENLSFEIINTFAIAYDTDADACYIVDRELDGEDKKLAEYYKIKLVPLMTS